MDVSERATPGARRRVHRLVFGAESGIAGTVYGTILVMAALAAGSAGHAGPGRLAVVVSLSVLAVWVAHVYSHSLAESIERGRRVTVAEFREIAERELPIALAALAPAVALLLGAFGIVRESTAVWLAYGVCLAALTVQGIRYATVEHLGGARTWLAVLTNLALGLAVVALKVFVGHH